MTKRVAVIKGDGTGPELVEALMTVLEASGTKADLVMCEGGYDWWKKSKAKTLIPEDTWEVLNNSDACFKGPTTTPGGAGSPKSVAVSIRQSFELYANVRPIKSFPNTRTPLGEVDFLCVREGTEGLYYGKELKLGSDIAIALRKITRRNCERIARYAFAEASRRGWKCVVAIHKSNILKQTCGMFLEEAGHVSRDYSNIELWEYHIDNVAQQLIKNPQLFNKKILLSTNLFMDVLSEECSALVGSIGLIASANIGSTYAMFEPAHGSAPKYAGKDVVNPTATILSGAWLLEYLGESEKGKAIHDAVEEVIAAGKKVTYDLGGKAKTSEMAEEIARITEKRLS